MGRTVVKCIIGSNVHRDHEILGVRDLREVVRTLTYIANSAMTRNRCRTNIMGKKKPGSNLMPNVGVDVSLWCVESLLDVKSSWTKKGAWRCVGTGGASRGIGSRGPAC